MKPIHLAPFVAFVLAITGCDRKSADNSAADHLLAQQVAELERKNIEAIARQQELEQEIESQKIAAERDAIERERLQIEEARSALEQKQNEDASIEAAALVQREKDLAYRESKVEFTQTTLEEKQQQLVQKDSELNERDRQIAGREAIANQDDEPEAEADSTPVGDYGMFHDSLSSYGSWFETPDYGYVWQPVIVRDNSWRPYTRGRWACSDNGWTWISDEPFGWATYHYGRWALCRGHGWIWIPGSQWAPSWVSWRSSGNHIGWAPLPPESLAYQENRWDSNVDVTFGIGAPCFVFVETRYFGNSIHHHCLPFDRNPIFIQETVNITHIHVHNRRVICGGPTYGDVSKQVERPLPFYRLEMDRHSRFRDAASMRPRVEGNRLRISAPNLAAPWNQGLRPEKIRGRMENLQVVRTEDVRPEVKERFNQSRAEESRKATESIQQLGGEDEFRRSRVEQLANNNAAIEEQRRRNLVHATNPNSNVRPDIHPDKDLNVRPDMHPGTSSNVRPDMHPDKGLNVRPVVHPDKTTNTRPDTRPDSLAQSGSNPPKPKPGDALIRRPIREEPPSKPVVSAPPSVRPEPGVMPKPSAVPKPETRPSEIRPIRPGPGVIVKEDRPSAPDRRPGMNEATNQQRPQQPSRPDPIVRKETPDSRPSNAPDPRNSNAEKARLQQMEQAKQQQQQQAEANRQREQARQQQTEEARREQMRQQQAEANRQREQARQQQMEEARRDQMRQQQAEAQREQARQQQAEANRQREQARQQQQAEAQREQARQQQAEANRQRENERQKEQEESRRGRNR